MKRSMMTAAMAAPALILGWATPAAAAPDNDNTETITVDCDAPYGTLAVTGIARPEDDARSSTGWDADGHVYVLKAVRFDAVVTATVLDSEGTPLIENSTTFHDTETRGAQGVDRHTDLIRCTETDSGVDEFVIDEHVAEFLNADLPAPFDWADYTGQMVRIAFTGEGVFDVIAPGR